MIVIHLYFNLLKLAYSFSERRDIRFVLAETIGACVVLLGFALIGDRIENLLVNQLTIPALFARMGDSLLWALSFLAFSVASRAICKKDSSEVTELKCILALPASTDTSRLLHKEIVTVGIIDFCWLLMMSATYALILFASGLDAVSGTIYSGRTNDYYTVFFEESKELFGMSIDALFALGAVLAACMGIIWAGELWRKSDNDSRQKYRSTTVASMKMVIAFFVIFFGVGLFLCLPLYSTIQRLRSLVM